MDKMSIVIRADLKLSAGKAVAQGAHAAVGALGRSPGDESLPWLEGRQKKIVLAANSSEELVGLSCMAAEANLPWYLVRDHGLTEVEPGTVTALGIGPADEGEVDAITGSLKLYR